MRKLILPIQVLATLFIIASCNQKSKETTEVPTVTEDIPVVNTSLAKVPDSWITERVTKAEKRLNATPAGKVVWQAMEAHGGLQRWYENGPLRFHFNYQPLDGGVARNTYQTVDTWSSKARHQDAADRTSEYGWDGKNAWVTTKDTTTFKYNTRFWSLTPYFFIAQPFVLDGDGTNLELLDQKTYKNKTYDVVKVTFDPGTGDAPDDYYVLYFEANTHQLGVIRYIVSYPGYFEKGKHLPEKFMEVQGLATIKGIVLSKGYHTHWLLENETPGEHITTITIDNISFKPETEKSYFDIPDNTTVLKGL